MALTLSMLEQFRSERQNQRLPCVTPEASCSKDIVVDTDSDLYNLSDFDSPAPSRSCSPLPTYVPKICDLVPVLNELSSEGQQLAMSPKPQRQVMAEKSLHKHKRSLDEPTKEPPAKRLHTGSRRTSADSQASTHSNASGCSTKSIREERDWMMLDNLPRVPCLTRRQSRELSRIIHGRSAARDRRTIHSSLDPSIFDPEISDGSEDDDGKLDLLPEIREELQQLLEPAELGLAYDETAELPESSGSSDDLDELPDLILLSSDEETEQAQPEGTHDHMKRPSNTSLSDVTPVFDKLQFKPLVMLEDCMPKPQIKKKLKLKSQPDKCDNEDCSDNDLTMSSEEQDTSSYESTKIGIPSSKLVWTPQQHHKLMDICSKVQIKLSRCDSLIRQRTRDEDTTSVSSDGKRERHFMDVLSTSNAGSRVSSDSDRDSLPAAASVNSWLKSNFETDISESDITDSESDSDVDEEVVERRRLAASSHTGSGRVVLASTQNIHKPVIKPKLKCSRSLLSLRASLHGLQPCDIGNSQGSDPGQSARAMNQHIVNIIENSDIEGDKYQLRYLNMCKSHVSLWSEPTVEIVQQIFKFLLNTSSCVVAWKSYSMLTDILDMHPSCHPDFDWEVLEGVVDRLMLPLGIHNRSPDELYAPALALQYLVSLLESDLLQRTASAAAGSADAKSSNHGSLQRHIVKSVAFQWLSLERGSRYATQVVEWTIASLTYGQHLAVSSRQPSTFKTFSPRRVQRVKSQSSVTHIPRVLPLFQRLLHLVIVVSRRTDNSLHKLVAEIVRGFMHTPIAFHRQLLLSTIVSPLLKFKLVQLILDEYGSMSASASCPGLSVTLRDIFVTYSNCEPPLTTLTPPLTPSDRDGDICGKVTAAREPSKKYSPESVEELCFLMWVLVASYFEIRKPEKEAESLQHFDKNVEDLRERYQSLTTDITPKTELYLTMMLGLKAPLTA